MHGCSALLVLLLLLAALSGEGGGQVLDGSDFSDHKQHGHRILLHKATIDTRIAPQIHEEQHPSPHFSGLSVDELLDNEQRSTFLLHLSPEKGKHKSLKEYIETVHHMKLVEYLPHNTFVVEATYRQAREMQKYFWVGHLRPKNKLLELPPATGSFLSSDDDTLTLVVSFVRQSPPRSDLHLDMLAVRVAETLSNLKLSSMPAVTPLYTQHNRLVCRFGSGKDRDDAKLPLASMPEVLRVESLLALKVKNKWAKGIVEEGASAAVSADMLVGSCRAATVAHHIDEAAVLQMSGRHGLQGQGQIVGVADTGLDVNNCFFSDPGGPDPFVAFTPTIPTSANFNADALANARKVVSYVRP